MGGDHSKKSPTKSNKKCHFFLRLFFTILPLLLIVIGFDFCFFANAVPHHDQVDASGKEGPHQKQPEEEKASGKKKRDISFWIYFVIPVNEQSDDSTLKAFVGTAIYSRNKPELLYVPPQSSSSPKLQQINTENIAADETDKSGKIHKIRIYFIFHSTWNDVRAEKQMGLRLLSELLHSVEFLHKNQHQKSLIATLNEKLEESGLKLPQPSSGHFQLTIFDGQGEVRLTELFPAHLKLIEKNTGTHISNIVEVRLELVDVKDALKKSSGIKMSLAKKYPDAAVHFQILIPTGKELNKPFRAFVELTLRTSSELGNSHPVKSKQQDDPVLSYVHPGQPEGAITTTHIEKTNDNKMISTGFSFHSSSSSSQHNDEDHGGEKQMGLRLLYELLHSGHRTRLDTVIITIGGRLAQSGLSMKDQKNTMGGHFNLELPNEKDKYFQRAVELFPGPINLVHSHTVDNKPDLLTVRFAISAMNVSKKKPAPTQQQGNGVPVATGSTKAADDAPKKPHSV